MLSCQWLGQDAFRDSHLPGWCAGIRRDCAALDPCPLDATQDQGSFPSHGGELVRPECESRSGIRCSRRGRRKRIRAADGESGSFHQRPAQFAPACERGLSRTDLLACDGSVAATHGCHAAAFLAMKGVLWRRAYSMRVNRWCSTGQATQRWPNAMAVPLEAGWRRERFPFCDCFRRW